MEFSCIRCSNRNKSWQIEGPILLPGHVAVRPRMALLLQKTTCQRHAADDGIMVEQDCAIVTCIPTQFHGWRSQQRGEIRAWFTKNMMGMSGSWCTSDLSPPFQMMNILSEKNYTKWRSWHRYCSLPIGNNIKGKINPFTPMPPPPNPTIDSLHQAANHGTFIQHKILSQEKPDSDYKVCTMELYLHSPRVKRADTGKRSMNSPMVLQHLHMATYLPAMHHQSNPGSSHLSVPHCPSL